MKRDDKGIKIDDNIFWVGAIDYNLRDFHGYLTKRGTTYNAYLIMDEKITLIDTVRKTHKEPSWRPRSAGCAHWQSNVLTRQCNPLVQSLTQVRQTWTLIQYPVSNPFGPFSDYSQE